MDICDYNFASSAFKKLPNILNMKGHVKGVFEFVIAIK